MSNFISTRDAYGEILVKIGEENPNIVVLDADLSKSTRTSLFAEKFPERFFNFGIAEANMISTAAGLATCGKIPFVSTFAVFASGRAFDQIRMSVCYSNTNVKIVATHSGLSVGEDGASHQALEDISLMRTLPNLVVIVPADAVETKKAVMKASEFVGPVYIRLGRPKVPIIYKNDYEFKIGKAVILKEGKDIGIICCGIMVGIVLEAVKILEENKISARVINMHTIKPIDKNAIIETAKKCKKIITVEDHTVIGGLGSAVSEVIVENFPVMMRRIGVNDMFGESGSPEELFKKHGLTKEHIVEVAKELCNR